MEARGITGRDLAKETGVSEGTIYNALGRRPILLRNAKLIAGALQRVAVDPTLSRLVLARARSGSSYPRAAAARSAASKWTYRSTMRIDEWPSDRLTTDGGTPAEIQRDAIVCRQSPDTLRDGEVEKGAGILELLRPCVPQRHEQDVVHRLVASDGSVRERGLQGSGPRRVRIAQLLGDGPLGGRGRCMQT